MKSAFLQEFWELFKGYWSSEEKWRARGLLTVVILLNFAVVYALVLLNNWNNDFYNALQNYKLELFLPLVGKFTLIAFSYIVVAVYAMYLRQMLQIKWRIWMTNRYMDKWMKDRVYYKMQILTSDMDNPDQRISEDINQFVTLTLQLTLGGLKQVTTLIAFVVILWTLSGALEFSIAGHSFTVYGYMVWLSLVYAIVGTFLTHRVGRKLIQLNFDQQRYEANFRFNMMRVRENSESVAFYGGEEPEQNGFKERFADVIKNYWSLIHREKALSWFTSGYGQTAIIVPILLAAPRYFTGKMQLGGFTQTIGAFGNVQDALSYIIDSYTSIAQLTAVIHRLDGFRHHMEEAGNVTSDIRYTDNGEVFNVENLQVKLPAGAVLLEDCSLTLKPGEYLLITGNSGCGKSTLLRTLAGLWPFGGGKLDVPKGSHCLFLPQRPYLPLGSLRQAICYPKSRVQATDEELCRLLKLCKLVQFMDKLDVVDDWSHILSLGEQQRIAFARILLVKPDWAFLDESTSALDEPLEKAMYELLRRELPQTAVVSVGHHSTLLGQHEKNLQLKGNGDWQLQAIHESGILL